MRNRYNSIRRIQKYTARRSNPTAPTTRSCRSPWPGQLFESSPSRMKQFYEINFARHNDTPPPAYYAALADFLDRVDEQSGSKLPSRLRRRQRQLVS